MIDRALTDDPAALRLLARHPKVQRAELASVSGIQFRQGEWTRSVVIGDPSIPISGLVELIDNNPIVCADVVSVPDVASTLALIALGPLADASLISETPVLSSNAACDADTIGQYLLRAGWPHGFVLNQLEPGSTSVVRLTAFVAIRTPDNLDDIDDLYDERFGRSFFVRRDEESDWSDSRVAGQPYALYRVRVTPDEPLSLLTISVMADLDGKCGAAQMVHAMNVMAGLEESLGIA